MYTPCLNLHKANMRLNGSYSPGVLVSGIIGGIFAE